MADRSRPGLGIRGAKRLFVSGLALALVLVAARSPIAQSLTYSRGQNVSPAFEGWETDQNGTSSFVFGYMNNNWEEEVDVPVGPDNSFDLLGADLGQPTRFLPRRNRFVFKVPVPKDFGKKELVWTLKTHGVTERAHASLKYDYFIDHVVVASETGALGPGSSNPTVRANTPPVLVVEGERTRRAVVGQPLELVAVVKDDGIPKAPGQGSPRPSAEAVARRAMMPVQRLTVSKFLGLHLSWFVYRGAGSVKFDPDQVKPWEDTRTGANSPWAPLWIVPAIPAANRWMVRVTFDEPGSYVLRARADDGALLADQELSVTVGR